MPIGIPGAGTVGACARCGPKSGDSLTKNLNHRNLGSFDRRGPAIVGHRPEFGKKSTTDTIRPCRDRDHFDRHANTAQYRSPCRADVIIGHKPSLQGRAHGTAGRLATRQKTPLTGQLVAKLGSEKRRVAIHGRRRGLIRTALLGYLLLVFAELPGRSQSACQQKKLPA